MTETPGRYQRPLLLLRFEGDEYDGLVVRCRRPSIDDVLAMEALRGLDLTGGDPDVTDEAIERGLAAISRLIANWNIYDEQGQPVPISAGGLRSLDLVFVMTLLGKVMTTSIGVSRPLSPASSGGDPSLEASIPMETLSEPPPSTDTPD